jgi:hypothetical protein
MIAPPTADLEVLRREPLAPKPKSLDEPQRRLVARLDIGFDTVKTVHPERLPHDRPQSF